jgi:hypothetical protein
MDPWSPPLLARAGILSRELRAKEDKVKIITADERLAEAREETEPEPITYTQVFSQLRHDVARRSGAHPPHPDNKDTAS